MELRELDADDYGRVFENDDDYDRAVAFGCLTFEQLDLREVRDSEAEIDLRQWADDVERALGSVPSVNDIKVRVPTRSVIGAETERGGKGQIWLTGHRFIPHPINGSVSFSVSIPQRVQPELFGGRNALNSELFHVHTTFAGLFPVTVVISDKPEQIPAHSITLVREFLVTQLKLHKGEKPITVGGLGPTPLPIDGYARLGAESPVEKSTRFRLQRREGRRILRVKAETDDPGILASEIASATYRELGLFYRIVATRNEAMFSARAVENRIHELVALHRKRSPYAWAKRLVTSGQTATLISLDVHEQRRWRSLQIDRFAALRDREAERTEFGYFMALVDREIEKLSEISADDAALMVDLINNRHTRSVQAVSVVAASLLGGVAGAAITAASQVQT